MFPMMITMKAMITMCSSAIYQKEDSKGTPRISRGTHLVSSLLLQVGH